MASSVSGKKPRVRRPAAPAIDPSPTTLPASALGTLVALSAEGVPLVRVGAAPAVPALVVRHVSSEHLVPGAPVLVVPLANEAGRLVIIGVVGPAAPAARRPAVARIDGRRVDLTGEDEVVLTCGKASITLTRAGKVIIKGTYVSSGSAGVHRITGGSVQIN